MTARVISRVPWGTDAFSGWRCRIEADSADEAEAALAELGLVADIVPAGDGEFEVLVIAEH